MPRYTTASLLLVLAMSSGLHAAECLGYSGMVRIADNTYLTVNDRKNPIQPGFRLGVLTVTPHDGTSFHPLHVEDWGDGEKEPSDLEACCAVPGRPAEYLLVESGQFRQKFGRLFHVRVARNAGGEWEAVPLGKIKLPYREPDPDGSTRDVDQVEGIACFPVMDKLVLVLGERGGVTKSGHRLGRLVWGEIDLTNWGFTRLGEADLVAKSVLGGRDCSDLYVDADGNNWTVWAVATRDIGRDAGPFHSVVYRAGKFVIGRDDKAIRFDREEAPLAAYDINGVKVEALAAPAKCIPDGAFSIGTDDEGFGGIWRALFRRP